MAGINWAPVFDAVVLLLATLLTALTPIIVRFLKAKVAVLERQAAEADSWVLREAVSMGINAAERLGNTPAEKKDMARNYVMRELAERGISVSEAVIDQTIEASLSAVRGVFDRGK